MSYTTLVKPAQVELKLNERIERSEEVAATSELGSAWRLEWQKRGGRAGEDWVLRVGLMVADEGGMVTPMHTYLRATLNRLAEQLSAPTEQWRDAFAVERMVNATLAAAMDVAESPVEMPEHFAAYLAHAMLWTNFLDAALALVDVALEGEGTTLVLDAHTLGIIAPNFYASKRANVPGAEPCTDFYAVSGPDRADRGWHTATEEGLLAPSVIWALMNALNCQFEGPAALGKEKMRSWCASVTKRLLQALRSEGVSEQELMALCSTH